MVIRNSNGGFLAVIYEGIGKRDNYWAECLAIIVAAEYAVKKGWENLWLESDSSATVSAFQTDKVPWKLKTRWMNCKENILNLNITHIWREASLVADQDSKMGVVFQSAHRYECEEKPMWIKNWEVPYDHMVDILEFAKM
ncbi:hypothetical protein ACHQM5_010307 [Ranunculus cassubicifolius]